VILLLLLFSILGIYLGFRAIVNLFGKEKNPIERIETWYTCPLCGWSKSKYSSSYDDTPPITENTLKCPKCTGNITPQQMTKRFVLDQEDGPMDIFFGLAMGFISLWILYWMYSAL